MNIPDGNNCPSTVADLGASSKAIHKARRICDAEAAEPGATRRAIDETIEAGEEPTRVTVHRKVLKATPKANAKMTKAPGIGPGQGSDDIARRAAEAIVTIAGMPSPAEVVRLVRDSDHASRIDECVHQFAAWAADFSRQWG